MGIIQSTATATIATDSSLSGGCFLGEKILVGIDMPASWTAADITFQVSYDAGVTWRDLYDTNGNAVKVTSPAAGTYRSVDPSDFGGCLALKLRSGTSQSPVVQGADRIFTLVTRKFFPTA